jgi:hypothetical protein
MGQTLWRFVCAENHEPLPKTILPHLWNVKLVRRLCKRRYPHFGSHCLRRMNIPDAALEDLLWDAQFSDSIITDLKQVTHIALDARIWRPYTFSPLSGNDLWTNLLQRFENLKQVLLVHEGNDSYRGSSSATPRSVVFEGKPRPIPIGNYWLDVVEAISQLDASFYDRITVPHKGLQKEGTAHPGSGQKIQKVRIVAAERIPNIPDDNWDRDEGEPFVCISSSVSQLTNGIQYVPQYATRPLRQTRQARESRGVDWVPVGSNKLKLMPLPVPSIERRIWDTRSDAHKNIIPRV